MNIDGIIVGIATSSLSACYRGIESAAINVDDIIIGIARASRVDEPAVGSKCNCTAIDG